MTHTGETSLRRLEQDSAYRERFKIGREDVVLEDWGDGCVVAFFEGGEED